MSVQASNRKHKTWSIIVKRELGAYFSSPVAYIVGALFLLFTGLLFFSTFFLSGRAELRGFFSLLPLAFSLFIPALTMRTVSEEKRSGSFETLLTLPVTSTDIVAGKYIAAFISSVALLLPTIFYIIACCLFGKPDVGPIIGGYVGAVFLAAAFSAIGIFSSACTKNQIIAFFIALAICGFLSLVGTFSFLLPGVLVSIATFISATGHFDSISRGIIDTRDILYFLSVTAFFLALTVRTLENSRKG